MKKLVLVVIFTLGTFGLPNPSAGQTSSWITSISYEQNTASTGTSLDVHVSLLQPGAPGYPCAAPTTLTVGKLILRNADVTTLDGTAHVNPDDLDVKPDGTGYVYHIPVGPGLDLPNGWDTVAFRIPARCTNSASAQESPAVVVRRYATINAFKVSIDGGRPHWNRSVNQDTLSLVMKTNWAVAVSNLVIKDDGGGDNQNNTVTNSYSEPVESTNHSITLKVAAPLSGGRQYKYQVQFHAADINVTPSTPLLPFNMEQEPTKDFILFDFPTPEKLVVKDSSKDFTFQAQTSDEGTLNLVFDDLKINGSSVVSGVASTGNKFTFTIPKEFLKTDGQYAFRFSGLSKKSQGLDDPHPSSLKVTAQTALKGPIGLSLNNKNTDMMVSYCLSQDNPNVDVRIAEPPSKPVALGPGDPVKNGTVDCGAGLFPYTSTIPLSSFQGLVSTASGTQPSSAASSSNSTQPNDSTRPQSQLKLCIVDESADDPSGSECATSHRKLATLNIAAVLVPKPVDAKAVSDALTKLSSKNKDEQSAATKTLNDLGLDQTTITSLAQVVANKKSGGAASTIGTVLATIGKTFLTAYLGIPAAPAAAAK